MATDKRLIIYDDLKQEIIDFKKGLNPRNTDYATGYFSALSVVEGMMVQHIAEETVEVVRCKDCKWYNRNEDIMPQSGSCEFHEMVKMDWDFCSRAKMDGDGNGGTD